MVYGSFICIYKSEDVSDQLVHLETVNTMHNKDGTIKYSVEVDHQDVKYTSNQKLDGDYYVSGTVISGKTIVPFRGVIFGPAKAFSKMEVQKTELKPTDGMNSVNNFVRIRACVQSLAVITIVIAIVAVFAVAMLFVDMRRDRY